MLRVLLLVLSVLVALFASNATDVLYDDDLSQTNADAEGYSATACAKYLCSKYTYETKSFLKAGCEGDFSDYVPDGDVAEGQVNIGGALIVVGCSFVGAFVFGIMLGKHYKPETAGSSSQS